MDYARRAGIPWLLTIKESSSGFVYKVYKVEAVGKKSRPQDVKRTEIVQFFKAARKPVKAA
jgi:hypothetical protein